MNIVHHSRQERFVTRVGFIQLQSKLQLGYGRVEGEGEGGKVGNPEPSGERQGGIGEWVHDLVVQ